MVIILPLVNEGAGKEAKHLKDMVLEKLLRIEYPILLGAMARITDPVLVSAVSEAGGLGTLAAATETPDSLAVRIAETRSLTKKNFAVNIPLLVRGGELVDTAIKEGVKVVITAAGNPRLFTKKLKDAGCTVLHVVPSPKMAMTAEEAGVDAVIAEGFESGGKASPLEIGTFALVPQVVDAVRVPVIAAGGISDARGYLAARVLGAAGVSMGTAFLASRECVKIGDTYRRQLLAADAADTAIVARNILGMRAIKNRRFEELENTVANGIKKEDLIRLMFSSDLFADKDDLFSCGQGVGLIREIKSVKEIIDGIITGAERICKAMA